MKKNIAKPLTSKLLYGQTANKLCPACHKQLVIQATRWHRTYACVYNDGCLAKYEYFLDYIYYRKYKKKKFALAYIWYYYNDVRVECNYERNSLHPTLIDMFKENKNIPLKKQMPFPISKEDFSKMISKYLMFW